VFDNEQSRKKRKTYEGQQRKQIKRERKHMKTNNGNKQRRENT
jgi:hypothetical protein